MNPNVAAFLEAKNMSTEFSAFHASTVAKAAKAAATKKE